MMAKGKGESLTMKAYEQIRNDILSCRLLPGQKIVISDLAAEFGYSLGAIREALSRLNSEGLVRSEPNKGFHVAPITQAELEDLTKTRVFIEGECLRNAIQHGDLKWETNIVSTLFELSRTPLQDPADPDRINDSWSAVHSRFHEALVAACDSPWLLRLREILYVQSERYRSVSVPLDRKKRDINAEHQVIADATIARDADAAVDALSRHLLLTKRILAEADVTATVKRRAAAV